jgi:CRP/FNR family transcriptional regulator
VRLDVRALPTWERHARIRERFEALREGASLTVAIEHEPRPLRLQFEEWYAGRFVWSQRHLGARRWEATIRRIASAPEPEAIVDVLRRSPAFADGRAETRDMLARHAVERTYAEGTPIADQDVQWPYLGVVRSGTVAAIMGSAAGRDLRLFDVFIGETFGNVELFDGGRTVARFIATAASTRIILLARGVVTSAMSSDAAVSRALATECAQRVRALADGFSAHVAQPALARVATAILPYASPGAGLSPALEPLLRMSQTELAVIAGTAKEVAARAVAELEAAGVLKRRNGHIALVDREKLKEVAHSR